MLDWTEQEFERLGGLQPSVGLRFIPFEAAEIEAIEELIAATLPERYRSFLLRFGGVCFGELVGYEPKQRFPPAVSRCNRGLFGSLFCAKSHRETYSLERIIKQFSKRVLPGLIPIGEDGGAGLICLAVAGDSRGKVYYWSMKLEPADDEPRVTAVDNVFLIADSFPDFLQRLFVLPE